jgi:hypothetical protein
MNALARWKILLALIATFAAGAITGGFLTGRVTKEIASILTQMENELSNLRSLDVRETDGIFARAKDRMDPIVAPDQRSRLQEIIDEHRRRFEETSWIVERPR